MRSVSDANLASSACGRNKICVSWAVSDGATGVAPTLFRFHLKLLTPELFFFFKF